MRWKDLKLLAHPKGWRPFDLASDPLENEDISEERREEARPLLEALENWRATTSPAEASPEVGEDAKVLLKAHRAS